jgi:hypothetical protein
LAKPETVLQPEHDAETSLEKIISKDSDSVGLARSTTRESQSAEASELSKTISKGTDAVSNILGPDEPLVIEKIPGAVDAPGAFPGMEGPTDVSGGVSLEEPHGSTAETQKPSAGEALGAPAELKPLGGRIEDELEKKKEEPSSTVGTAPPNEGAGSTQSFSG